jgi:hypothetical protein
MIHDLFGYFTESSSFQDYPLSRSAARALLTVLELVTAAHQYQPALAWL